MRNLPEPGAPSAVPMYVPHPVTPTMSDSEYYDVIYKELEWRHTHGDPLEGVAWGVSASLMEWDRTPGWNRSYFVNTMGPPLVHTVTPEAAMADSSYPWHIPG